MKGWRHIKEVALYQGGGAVWRGGAISRNWRYIKEVASYEVVAPYQGIGAISKRWRHMKGWRHIKEVALYQGSGAISRRWRHMKGWRHIKEVAIYQGGGVISRIWHPVQTKFGQSYRLQFLLPLPHLVPPDSSSVPLHTIRWTLSTTSAVLKPTVVLRHSGLNTRWVEAVH